MIMVKVTYKNFDLDDKPDVEYFDTMAEAHEWADEEIARRVEWAVNNSPYPCTKDDEREMLENELSFISFSEEYMEECDE